MTEYDLGKVVGDDGEAGNGIASITKTGTSGLVDTYTITYDDGTTTTFTVTNGSNASVTIQTSWGSTTSDSKVPSEKLTKDTLDTKSDVGHTHDDRYYTETEIDTALLIKQDLLVSGTNIKTINNESLLGSGNITIQGGGGGSVIGTGSFSIDTNGHLIVELPDAVDNPYYINNNGHLIYDTSNTHNGE